MKKKKWNLFLAVLILASVVLFVPIPSGPYNDGGTREYTALVYKIVDWSRQTSDGRYENSVIYFFPRNFMSIDELWTMEKDQTEQKFRAVILDLNGSAALVEPLENEDERRSSDKITFGLEGFEDIGAEIGSVVEITYTGGIMESYPAQIRVQSWNLSE